MIATGSTANELRLPAGRCCDPMLTPKIRTERQCVVALSDRRDQKIRFAGGTTNRIIPGTQGTDFPASRRVRGFGSYVTAKSQTPKRGE